MALICATAREITRGAAADPVFLLHAVKQRRRVQREAGKSFVGWAKPRVCAACPPNTAEACAIVAVREKTAASVGAPLFTIQTARRAHRISGTTRGTEDGGHGAQERTHSPVE